MERVLSMITVDDVIPTHKGGRGMERVLSGIRATGRLHFGNFLGAVQHFVRFQNSGDECYFFIADQHTLTTMYDPEKLRSNILDLAIDYLAAGLDPNRSVLYTQSSIPEIPELHLYLSMMQPLGELENIPTYKDKVRDNPHNVNLGLIMYPVLMAADIFGPRSTLVPVGEDQVPNLELVRNLGRRFNNKYGDTFVIPRTMDEMIKVPGLDGSKMGKSNADNAIDINAPIDHIRKRYRDNGVTDLKRTLRSTPGNPYECKSVYPVHEIITIGETDTRNIAHACEKAEIGCVECKDHLVDNLATLIGPYQERRRELETQTGYVKDVLHEGGMKARMVIKETLETVRDKMGIVIY